MRKKKKELISEGYSTKQIKMEWSKKVVRTNDMVFKIKDGAIFANNCKWESKFPITLNITKYGNILHGIFAHLRSLRTNDLKEVRKVSKFWENEANKIFRNKKTIFFYIRYYKFLLKLGGSNPDYPLNSDLLRHISVASNIASIPCPQFSNDVIIQKILDMLTQVSESLEYFQAAVARPFEEPWLKVDPTRFVFPTMKKLTYLFLPTVDMFDLGFAKLTQNDLPSLKRVELLIAKYTFRDFPKFEKLRGANLWTDADSKQNGGILPKFDDLVIFDVMYGQDPLLAAGIEREACATTTTTKSCARSCATTTPSCARSCAMTTRRRIIAGSGIPVWREELFFIKGLLLVHT
ncbi:hypothetical protein Fcan01_22985 [Folsomia candida]|uniref:Uncharacterized protein n=1 Tax=Folsomia candida TaxID=158441 RepID=A0A226DCG0_FOLCA|nr:hypothetical protein Fcan01_22985 [Folsomia candida]